MIITLQLFGRFRDLSEHPEIRLELPDITTVAEFRDAFDAWALAHWADYAPGLLKSEDEHGQDKRGHRQSHRLPCRRYHSRPS